MQTLFDYTKKDCLEGVKSRIGIKRDDIPWIETKLDPDFQIKPLFYYHLPMV